MISYKKIIIPTNLHPDTIIAIFILKDFGKEAYPGIAEAEIEILNTIPENETSESLSEKGFFLIDIGGSNFDHHSKNKTASQLIAEDLKIENDPALSKLLTLAERDDKYGLGTISTDSIDKAFGLAGLISNLNKNFPSDPQKIIDLTLPIIRAHYLEERRRYKDLPEEFEQKLKDKKAEVFVVKQKDKKIKVVAIESDNPSIIGWLRASIGEKADVVLQKNSSGNVNIITKPLKRVDLRLVAAFLRQEEININNREIKIPPLEIIKPGRIQGAPEWYYDLATNSVLNGGINPKGTPPTSIPFERIKEIVKDGLGGIFLQKNTQTRIEEAKYFLEVRVPLDVANNIREMIENQVSGLKIHLPENYHFTLIYLGEYGSEEIYNLIEQIRGVLEKINSFSVVIDSKNLRVGEVPGYKTKASYFLIENNQGGRELRNIRFELEKIIPRFQKQEFFPHLTVATVISGIEEKIISEAEIKIKEEFKINFFVEKIRLTEIIKKQNGLLVYRNKHYFPLYPLTK